MNTRAITAALGILGILVLNGCAQTDSTSTDAKPTTTAPTKSNHRHTTDETAFLVTTRAKVPELNKLPDAQLIDFGHKACDAIDAGNSPIAVTLKAEEGLQLGDENSAYIVGAAVNTFCPEHKDEL
ncbi:DUF732 domain-containing protein [Streptomyces sp. LaPpAH-108]|uniref:DUF732 domain-containing protein n=1 Tax=Streptomyces sp. LaPpAH-108 TaxID=1155714 RepID=UPI000368C387|nr:DUF732 domain-containing protein [Streptomyces sp. LaPpAH-108]